MYLFQEWFKNIKKKLKQWNKEVFGNIFQAKKDLEMENIQQRTISEGCFTHLAEEEATMRT